MKISEMIAILQRELEARGNIEVHLHGTYGASETTFEVMPNNHVPDDEQEYLNIWTNINTG